MVPDVERLGAEGKAQALEDRERLKEGKVRIRKTGTAEDVPAHVAIGENSLRDVAGDRERGLVDAAEQVTGAAVVHRRLEDVGALRTLRAGIRGVGVHGQAEGCAALGRENRVQLPSGEGRLGYPVRCAEE